MTARFGRNKRRAALAAVTAARGALALSELKLVVAINAADLVIQSVTNLAEKAVLRADTAERLLGDINQRLQRAVGRDSGLIPFELQMAPKSARDDWARRYHVRRDLNGYRAEPIGASMLEVNEGSIIELMRLVVSVENDASRFGRVIRFVDSADKHDRAGYWHGRAYWVSRDHLQQVGFTGRDFDHLVQEIARGLLCLEGDRV